MGSSLVRYLIFCVLGVALLAAGCSSETENLPTLQSVAVPEDLGDLDLLVQKQFEQLWGERLAIEAAGGGATELARAWGVLGQWFDVYMYAQSARRCYGNAARLDPADPRWPYLLGILEVDAGELDLVARYYVTSARLAPDAVAPKVRLGELALQRQDLTGAAALFNDALASHPDSPGARFGIAQIALMRGEAGRAAEILQRLLEEQPEAADVHYALAMAWRQLGDDARARAQLAHVPEDNLEHIPLVRDDPWQREVHRLDKGSRTATRRGVQAFRRGDLERAAVHLGRAVAADPSGPEERINYALVLAELGRPRLAWDQLQAAVRLAGEDRVLASRAHMEAGRLLAAEGRPAAAALEFEAALASGTNPLAANVQLGSLRYRLGEPERALEHYAAAAAIDPTVDDLRFWRAAVLLTLERPGEAVRVLEEGAGESARGDRAQLLLARLRVLSKDRDLRDPVQAAELLEAARPEAEDVFFAETAAMLSAADGRYDEARGWQERALAALDASPLRTATHRARRRLELYRINELPEPWEPREAPVLLPLAPATTNPLEER